MGTADGETTRTVVQTYIPEYQRDEWDAHAEELDMNRSEFIRTMVQAGRRGVDEYVDDEPASSETAEVSGDTTTQRKVTQNPSHGATGLPDDSLEDVVIEELQSADCLSWDDLVTEITDDIEARLEETLQRLQSENRVRYSGRQEGYVLNEDDAQ